MDTETTTGTAAATDPCPARGIPEGAQITIGKGLIIVSKGQKCFISASSDYLSKI